MKAQLNNQKTALQLALIGVVLISIIAISAGLKTPPLAKPTLKEKVLAIAETGKKIAVVYVPSNVTVQQPMESQKGRILDCRTAAAHIKIPEPQEYAKLAYVIADDLNSGFGASVFEVINIKDVPTKKGKFLGAEIDIEDWWNTEYDMIVRNYFSMHYAYDLEMSNATEHSVKLSVTPKLEFLEVIDGEAALKPAIATVTSLGYSTSESVTTKDCFTTNDEFTSKVAEPSSLIEPCKAKAKEKLTEFIEKQNAKYDKAMKKNKK